jgi:uncharacterized membrane protein
MQKKKHSFLESITNTLISTVISITISPFIYWFWNVPITIFQFTGVTITFIIISIVKNYLIRRYFNKKDK